jgi:predicted small secreted protein
VKKYKRLFYFADIKRKRISFMKKKLLTISLSLLSLVYVGCGTAHGSNGDIIITAGDKKADKLETLSVEDMDLKQTLTKERYKEITMDIDKFVPTAIRTINKSYKLDINFKNGKVLAYADCQKLTTKYKINNKLLSFSHVSYAPAIELATCVEVEDADQAVYQFLNGSYEAIKITENEIVFASDDIDAKVVLKR